MSTPIKLKETIYSKPLAQGLTLCFLAIVALCISAANDKPNYSSWIILNSTVLLFAVGNPLLSIFSKKWARYTAISLITFILMTLTLYFLTLKFSTNATKDVASYKFVLLTLIVFYVLLIGVSALFRIIIRTLEGNIN